MHRKKNEFLLQWRIHRGFTPLPSKMLIGLVFIIIIILNYNYFLKICILGSDPLPLQKPKLMVETPLTIPGSTPDLFYITILYAYHSLISDIYVL
jgi:MFS superfamily sulfate permease-like transporter